MEKVNVTYSYEGEQLTLKNKSDSTLCFIDNDGDTILITDLEFNLLHCLVVKERQEGGNSIELRTPFFVEDM